MKRQMIKPLRHLNPTGPRSVLGGARHRAAGCWKLPIIRTCRARRQGWLAAGQTGRKTPYIQYLAAAATDAAQTWHASRYMSIERKPNASPKPLTTSGESA